MVIANRLQKEVRWPDLAKPFDNCNQKFIENSFPSLAGDKIDGVLKLICQKQKTDFVTLEIPENHCKKVSSKFNKKFCFF
tara:strand:+ start:463 stop:702 length:240 start_codon:yes stop_codon:yes gene_type:complete